MYLDFGLNYFRCQSFVIFVLPQILGILSWDFLTLVDYIID
jgi:hypothetical protein